MPKSNEQIRREYNAKSLPSQLGIAADDLVRIAVGGLSGGMVDQALGGDNVERTREARVRAGITGDVANVGGMALGLKGGGAAIKSTVGAARAAPTAMSLVPKAGLPTALRYLTGTAGPGLVPAASRAVTLKGAGKLAGLAGLLGLSIAGRQDDTPAVAVKPAAPAQAKTVATKAPAAAERGPTPFERQLAFVDSMFRGPLTLREAQAASGMLPAPPKPQTDKDAAFGDTAAISRAIFQNDINNAIEKGKTDPAAGQELTAKALEQRFARQAALFGTNPMNLAYATQPQSDE